MERFGRHVFHILKDIHFTCFQINILYLTYGALNDRPASRAARKENCGVEVLAGSNVL